MKKILITGAHGDIGISVFKILKKNYKNKFMIDGMDYKSSGPAFFFFKKIIKSPHVNDKRFEYFTKKTFLKYDLIIPTPEDEIIYFCKNKKSFLKYPILINNPKVVLLFVDKILTNNFLIKNKILAPKFSIKISQLKNFKKPFFLKKKVGHGNINYKAIKSIKDFSQLKKLDKNQWIAQEYFDESYNEYTCCLIKLGNFIKTIILKRELLFGYTFYSEVVNDQLIKKNLMKLAKKLNFSGSINIQIKKRYNKAAIFEINPRLSSTVLMRDMYGFKDCKWWIEYFLYKKVPKKINVKRGKILKLFIEKFI